MSPEARERSFDALARELASGSLSRRKALRLMGAALVGSALASVPGVASAQNQCPEGQTRCRQRCVNLQRSERHCGACGNRCRSNQTCCEGRCVNLQRSERHCGRCRNRCAEGQACVDGVCGGEPTCPTGCSPCPTATSCCPTEAGCVCAEPVSSGPVCIEQSDPIAVSSCTECPPAGSPGHTTCVDLGEGGVFCARPCQSQC